MSVSKKLRLVFLKQTLFAGKTGKTELPFPTFTLYRSQYWKHMFDKFWNRDFLWWPRRFWITKAELLFPPFNLYRSQYWEHMFDRFWNKKWSLTSDLEIIFQNLWLKETFCLKRRSTMEELCQRFPLMSQKILNHGDNKALTHSYWFCSNFWKAMAPFVYWCYFWYCKSL